MGIYFRILKFARPFSRFALPYFLFILLHAVFNTMVYVVVIPIVRTLFDSGSMMAAVTSMPAFELKESYIRDLINYWLYRTYGADYDMMEVLVALSVVLVSCAFLNNLFRYLAQRVMEHLRIYSIKNIRNDIFSNVMSMHSGYFSGERKGDIISKLTSDVQVVQFTVTSTLQIAFREPLLVIGYLAVLIGISWKLTVFTVAVLPVSALIIGVIVKSLRKSARQAQESLADMVTTADEALGGVKILKGYNAIGYIVRKFVSQNELFSRISRSMANRQQMASPMSEFLGITAISVIFIYGGKMVLGGDLDGSQFIVYLGVFSQLTRPVRAFADAFANINQGIAAGERILGLIDTKPAIVDAPGAVRLTDFEKGIEFRNVTFSYENKKILKNISFTINKGETVALVGPSGGGKSTISDLIPRFYDPQEGSVTVDGTDIREYRMESLRDFMGIVAQDTVLFNDTIENNIKLGKQDATRSEVEAAAKIANAHDFITATEQGYDTNTGDRGMKLSGGQRQRLSIARAVLKNPDILILDEATSALDTESERLVQEALNNLLKGRTSLVIAHRLSTIQHADRIIVVDGGEIKETGTHNELILKDGIYKRLIDMQQIGGQNTDNE